MKPNKKNASKRKQTTKREYIFTEGPTNASGLIPFNHTFILVLLHVSAVY
jgi:hypothetical protein